MKSIIALTILAGKIELRKNQFIHGNWDVVIQVPTFCGADNLPKIYPINVFHNMTIHDRNTADNIVFSYIKGIIDGYWAEPSGYSFNENSTEEFNALINKLKPKALSQFMNDINVTENLELEKVIGVVKECFVKNAIES